MERRKGSFLILNMVEQLIVLHLEPGLPLDFSLWKTINFIIVKTRVVGFRVLPRILGPLAGGRLKTSSLGLPWWRSG